MFQVARLGVDEDRRGALVEDRVGAGDEGERRAEAPRRRGRRRAAAAPGGAPPCPRRAPPRAARRSRPRTPARRRRRAGRAARSSWTSNASVTKAALVVAQVRRREIDGGRGHPVLPRASRQRAGTPMAHGPAGQWMDQDGAGPQDGPRSDGQAGENDRAQADVGALAHAYSAAQGGPGRDVDAVRRSGVVLDHGSGVDDAAAAQPRHRRGPRRGGLRSCPGRAALLGPGPPWDERRWRGDGRRRARCGAT